MWTCLGQLPIWVGWAGARGRGWRLNMSEEGHYRQWLHEGPPSPAQTDWQTWLKTLPFCNFVGGKMVNSLNVIANLQILWNVTQESGGTITLSAMRSFTLPAGKQRWVAAGCILQEEDLLICGDRGGSVHVYQLDNEVKICNQAGYCQKWCGIICMYQSCINEFYRIQPSQFKVSGRFMAKLASQMLVTTTTTCTRPVEMGIIASIA